MLMFETSSASRYADEMTSTENLPFYLTNFLQLFIDFFSLDYTVCEKCTLFVFVIIFVIIYSYNNFRKHFLTVKSEKFFSLNDLHLDVAIYV